MAGIEGIRVPLEERTLSVAASNGRPKHVPAIHAVWVTPRMWMPYECPPADGQGDVSLWCEAAQWVADDLDFLLEVDYHRFWSHMTHDPALQPLLDQLLQRLPRYFDLDRARIEAQVQVHNLIEVILRKTFLCFVRLATYKESTANFMSPQYFGRLIYDHFLFNMPRLLDLCGLFRRSNPAILDKMLASVFKHQPAYHQDLAQSVQVVASAWQKVSEKVEIQTTYYNCDEPKKIRELRDVVAYVCDIIISVESLLLAYPPACVAFLEGQILSVLSPFYQNVLVDLIRFLNKQEASGFISSNITVILIPRLQMCRRACVSIFRQIVSQALIMKVLEVDSMAEKSNLAENFLGVLTACLSEGALIADYSKIHDLQDDLDVFRQAGADLDAVRTTYILEGIQAILIEFSEEIQRMLTRDEVQQPMPTQSLDPEPTLQGVTHETASPVQVPTDTTTLAAPPKMDEVQVLSLISQVKDLFPDLGDGFTEACLDYFDQEPEKVINALLEENLPLHLMDMDRTAPRKSIAPTPKPDKEPEVARVNVHDGDEFDINARNDIDLSRVHFGKQKITKKMANQILDDKSSIRELKDMYSKLSLVQDEILVGGEYDANYDDEYDDTYDDNAIGQAEPDAMDELTERRPFVLPQALGGGKVTYIREQTEREEDDEDDTGKKEFLRNPAEIREEKERKRQEHQARVKNQGKYGQPQRDVVGKAKGQGQEKNVLINRARKNTSKGKHHRAMADKKHQGMS